MVASNTTANIPCDHFTTDIVEWVTNAMLTDTSQKRTVARTGSAIRKANPPSSKKEKENTLQIEQAARRDDKQFPEGMVFDVDIVAEQVFRSISSVSGSEDEDDEDTYNNAISNLRLIRTNFQAQPGLAQAVSKQLDANNDLRNDGESSKRRVSCSHRTVLPPLFRKRSGTRSRKNRKKAAGRQPTAEVDKSKCGASSSQKDNTAGQVRDTDERAPHADRRAKPLKEPTSDYAIDVIAKLRLARELIISEQKKRVEQSGIETRQGPPE